MHGSLSVLAPGEGQGQPGHRDTIAGLPVPPSGEQPALGGHSSPKPSQPGQPCLPLSPSPSPSPPIPAAARLVLPAPLPRSLIPADCVKHHQGRDGGIYPRYSSLITSSPVLSSHWVFTLRRVRAGQRAAALPSAAASKSTEKSPKCCICWGTRRCSVHFLPATFPPLITLADTGSHARTRTHRTHVSQRKHQHSKQLVRLHQGYFIGFPPQNRAERLGGGNSRCGHKGVVQSLWKFTQGKAKNQ